MTSSGWYTRVHSEAMKGEEGGEGKEEKMKKNPNIRQEEEVDLLYQILRSVHRSQVLKLIILGSLRQQ